MRKLAEKPLAVMALSLVNVTVSSCPVERTTWAPLLYSKLNHALRYGVLESDVLLHGGFRFYFLGSTPLANSGF